MTRLIAKLFIVIFAFVSCRPSTERYEMLKDRVALKIIELQDQRNTAELIHYLKSKKAIHRAQAANAFASIQDTAALPFLYLTLLSEKDTLPRRAAAYAIGQTGDSNSVNELIESLQSETSNQTQIVILEAIGKCGGTKAQNFLLQFNPTEKYLKLGIAKATFRLAMLKQLGQAFSPKLESYLKSDFNPLIISSLQAIQRSKIAIDSTLLTHLKSTNQDREIQILLKRLTETPVQKPTLNFNDSFLTAFNQKTNPYHRSEMIKLLNSASVKTFQFLSAQSGKEITTCIRTEAAGKYIELWKIATLYPEHYFYHIEYCLKSQDPALISIAAIAIADSSTGLKSTYVNQKNILEDAKKALLMPRDMETLADIEKALAYLENRKYIAPKPVFNHPIDMEKLKSLGDVVTVVLETTKGKITMEWYPEKAPGSVSNILTLVEAGFYNGKYFHRVVPNFVIQGGCPRGDGWGALNWTQRSEFSTDLSYTRGTVGLASSGKDTEGVQFFITHCETPHLDGRYSIIGKVTDGLEVIDQIEVGDQIIKMYQLKTKSK